MAGTLAGGISTRAEANNIACVASGQRRNVRNPKRRLAALIERQAARTLSRLNLDTFARSPNPPFCTPTLTIKVRAKLTLPFGRADGRLQQNCHAADRIGASDDHGDRTSSDVA